MAKEIEDKEVGELWRRYKPLQGQDTTADLVIMLIRKLVIDSARSIPYGWWDEKMKHPLGRYDISVAEWNEE
jgi:hypothetical protein